MIVTERWMIELIFKFPFEHSFRSSHFTFRTRSQYIWLMWSVIHSNPIWNWINHTQGFRYEAFFSIITNEWSQAYSFALKKNRIHRLQKGRHIEWQSIQIKLYYFLYFTTWFWIIDWLPPPRFHHIQSWIVGFPWNAVISLWFRFFWSANRIYYL